MTSAAAALLLVLLAAAAGCGGGSGTEPEPGGRQGVRVAAAASLQYALDDVVDGFLRDNPEVRVEVSYGSSGSLLQQLANGAPFDLYLAADVSHPQRLVEEGLVEPEDVFGYAVGALVVWAGEGSPIDPTGGLGALVAADRIAIANPQHAPYGQAAVAAMRAAGVYEQVENSLVLGENVGQAAEFVASGNAEAGIVALSAVRSPPLREIGRWSEVPQELFPRLEQGGAVLTGSAGAEPARTLRDYLTGPAGAEILARYGFRPVEP